MLVFAFQNLNRTFKTASVAAFGWIFHSLQKNGICSPWKILSFLFFWSRLIKCFTMTLQVNRIRELPQNSKIIATHTDSPDVIVNLYFSVLTKGNESFFFLSILCVSTSYIKKNDVYFLCLDFQSGSYLGCWGSAQQTCSFRRPEFSSWSGEFLLNLWLNFPFLTTIFLIFPRDIIWLKDNIFTGSDWT